MKRKTHKKTISLIKKAQLNKITSSKLNTVPPFNTGLDLLLLFFLNRYLPITFHLSQTVILPSIGLITLFQWLSITCSRLSRKITWERFLNGAYLRRTYLQGQMHVLAGTDAVHCGNGCSALRERLQCTAGAVAVHCVWEGQKQASKSPALFWDKRIGRKNSPHTGHRSPWKYLLNPFSTSCSKQTTLDMIKVTTFAREKHRLKT